MKRKEALVFTLLTVLMALVLPACGDQQTQPTNTPQELRVLASAANYSGIGLSPHVWGTVGLARLLWAPLIAHDAQYHITSNGLAPAPDISADGLTYTFHLRKDAKYSDGSPVTAHDVEFDLRYDIMTGHPKIKGKELLGNYANRYYANVKGADAVLAGNVAPDEFNAAPVEGVKALDDATLQIQLVHPDPGFIFGLMLDAPSAVKPADIQRGEGKNYSNKEYWTTEHGVAYSGPFALSSYTPSQGMVLVPNTHFNAAKPKLQKISVTFVKDNATAITAFQNKEADWLDVGLSATDVQNARTDAYLKSTLVQGETNSVQQLFISAYAPLDDVHVRRAIYMAIDKKALTTVLGGGADQTFFKPIVAHVANANACPGIANTITPIKYDPAAAKSELALSKYGAAVKNMPINISIGLFGEDTTTEKVEAQFLQQALQSNLGFTNLQIRESPINDFNKPPYPTHIWPNEQGNRDPDLYGFLNNLVSLIPSQPIPASGPTSVFTLPYVPEVPALMKQAFAAPTLDQRCGTLSKVLQTWVDQAVTIDLFTNSGYTLVAPWVKNLHTADGLGGLEYLYLQSGIEDTSIAAH